MAHIDESPATRDRRARQGNSFGLNVLPAENSHSATATQASCGLPDSGRAALSRVAHVPAPRLGEESDDYPVIASLNDRWRVIACKNSIQWILQKRRGGPNHWRGKYFCRSREVLVRCAREYAGRIRGDTLVVLFRLPERFPQAAAA